MPKTVATAPKAEEQLSSTPPTVQQDKKLDDTKKHTFDPSAENGEMETKTSYHEQTKDHIFGLGSSLERLQYGKKVAASFGIAMVAMVVIGAYVAYKCGSNPSNSCIEDLGLK